MISKTKIIELLNSIHEHTMAKNIFVPILKQMGLKGVKFTGGADEQGIDIEYYELTQPENHKSYVGIQFKKGNLVYSARGTKNSVKEVKNQAEEAFEKEIFDINDHAKIFISRFIVAATGDINEKARTYIGKARLNGKDRRIDYWTGDRLAEYVQDFWFEEFQEYFSDSLDETEEIYESDIIDENFISESYSDLVSNSVKVLKSVNQTQNHILTTVARLSQEESISLGELLFELGKPEDYFRDDFQQLVKYDYLEIDTDVYLTGRANNLQKLYDAIVEELSEAEESTENADKLFDDVIHCNW